MPRYKKDRLDLTSARAAKLRHWVDSYWPRLKLRQMGLSWREADFYRYYLFFMMVVGHPPGIPDYQAEFRQASPNAPHGILVELERKGWAVRGAVGGRSLALLRVQWLPVPAHLLPVILSEHPGYQPPLEYPDPFDFFLGAAFGPAVDENGEPYGEVAAYPKRSKRPAGQPPGGSEQDGDASSPVPAEPD